ncbi:MAG: DUF3037 domain-containing protein [Bacteroidia bacterium]
MPDKHLYEYAVIRIVPLVEREEFLNSGIILFCKKAGYINVLFHLNAEKLRCFCKEIDVEQVRTNLEAFRKIALAEPGSGPVAAFDLPSRFRWLTAVKSAVIQTSRPHPGLCTDLDETTRRLFEELVL